MAKLLHPLVILVLTWTYGPAVMGVFFVAIFILDLVVGAAAWGFADASTIFTSRALGDGPWDGARDTTDPPQDARKGRAGEAGAREGESERSSGDRRVFADVYATLGGVLRWGVGLSLAASVGLFGLSDLVGGMYPDLPGLKSALRVLALAVPLMAWTQIAVGACKAHMRMEYDAAIQGFLNPVLRLASFLVAWWISPSVEALMVALVAAEAATALAAGWALSRHFSPRRTFGAALRGARVPGLVAFALPQSANTTLNRYLTRIDVLMLGAFGVVSDRLAYYATAALITSNLRHVRLVFSTALAPVAARHDARGERAALEVVLNRLSRWTTTLIVPPVLALVILREDLLRLFDASYQGESLFFVVLLISPLVGSSLGLFGNTIVYTGHSAWNLANSLGVAVLNTAFNLVLIPRWGLLGAAAGTACAATLVAMLQVFELRWLEGIRLRPAELWQPVAGLALAGAVLALLWDPAGLPWWWRVAAGIGLPAGFFVLQVLFGHPEVCALLRRVAGR